LTSDRRIAIAGASGLLGRAITDRLTRDGYRVIRISRGLAGSLADVRWNPASGELDARALQGVDAIVNLAGEPIAERWTDERRRSILESRVSATTLIARTAATLSPRPRVLLSASAIGYYGDREDETVDEGSAPGRGFLAEVVRAWEGAAEPARDAGIRVVHPRFGIVLSPRGGALARLLPFFRLGVGGKIGAGRQWMSWIGLTDTARAASFLVTDDSLGGAVNLTAPTPVRNAEFARVLGEVLHRPALATVPAFAIRLRFGAMGEETVLAGQRVLPTRLLRAGFRFDFPTLPAAIAHELA